MHLPMLALALLAVTWAPRAQSAQPTAVQLQALVDRAIASKATTLALPPGDYFFNASRSNFKVKGAEGLEIDATGATVWLWPGSFVDIHDSHRSTIKGLTVDFSPPCFSQGKVTAVHNASSSFELALDAGFLPPVPAIHPQFNATEVKLIYWDPQTRLIKTQPGSNPWDPAASQCRLRNGGSSCTLALGDKANPLPAVGDYVTASPRIGANMVIQTWYTSSFRHTNCSEMVAANVTLHGSGSMGFGEFGGEGGNTYTDCKNVRRLGSPHLLSSNHDGFHSYGVAKAPTLTRKFTSNLLLLVISMSILTDCV
jgi:hypothetical protein